MVIASAFFELSRLKTERQWFGHEGAPSRNDAGQLIGEFRNQSRRPSKIEVSSSQIPYAVNIEFIGENMRIAVLGGDGYCGWATALYLSATRQ